MLAVITSISNNDHILSCLYRKKALSIQDKDKDFISFALVSNKRNHMPHCSYQSSQKGTEQLKSRVDPYYFATIFRVSLKD